MNLVVKQNTLFYRYLKWAVGNLSWFGSHYGDLPNNLCSMFWAIMWGFAKVLFLVSAGVVCLGLQALIVFWWVNVLGIYVDPEFMASNDAVGFLGMLSIIQALLMSWFLWNYLEIRQFFEKHGILSEHNIWHRARGEYRSLDWPTYTNSPQMQEALRVFLRESGHPEDYSPDQMTVEEDYLFDFWLEKYAYIKRCEYVIEHGGIYDRWKARRLIKKARSEKNSVGEKVLGFMNFIVEAYDSWKEKTCVLVNYK